MFVLDCECEIARKIHQWLRFLQISYFGGFDYLVIEYYIEWITILWSFWWQHLCTLERGRTLCCHRTMITNSLCKDESVQVWHKGRYVAYKLRLRNNKYCWQCLFCYTQSLNPRICLYIHKVSYTLRGAIWNQTSLSPYFKETYTLRPSQQLLRCLEMLRYQDTEGSHYQIRFQLH